MWLSFAVEINRLYLFLQLMKATVLAENSDFIYFHFHRALFAPAMSTDVSQVGVALLR